MTLVSVVYPAAYDPRSRGTFFELTGAAAATLTGLFFIAFSLRLQDLQLSVLLRTRARYLLLWLIVITPASAFVLMPGQPHAALAAEILALSAAQHRRGRLRQPGMSAVRPCPVDHRAEPIADRG